MPSRRHSRCPTCIDRLKFDHLNDKNVVKVSRSQGGIQAIDLQSPEPFNFGTNLITHHIINKTFFCFWSALMNRLDCYRIGNQTSRHVDEMVPFDFALKQGFRAFEWFSDTCPLGWCEKGTTTTQRSKLRHIGESCGISFSVHAPHLANPENHHDAGAILESIHFGGDIGAKIVNIHLFKSQSYRRFAESLIPLIEEAKQAGMRLSLENTPETSPDDFNAIFGILGAMPETHGYVGMCLDSGHANLHHGTRNNFLQFLDFLGEHVPIIHWHAHENWGDKDSHLPLFRGPSSVNDRGLRSLIKKLNQRGFSGAVILEQWPDPPELLFEACEKLKRLIGEQASCDS